jgi:hypothetical protein
MIFALLLVLAAPPALEVVERPVALASLTSAQAALDGKLRLFKVVLDSAGTEHGGRVGYDALHGEPAVMGSVYLAREVNDDVTTVYLRGVLKVIPHPRRGSRGQFGGLVELRVIGKAEALFTRTSARRIRLHPAAPRRMMGSRPA